MQEEKKKIEYENEKAYNFENIIEKEKNKNQKENYYEKSIYSLIQYMKINEQNPSENKWDNIAVKNKYLSSKTMGYLSAIGFNKLCRKLRKAINRNKRQIK